MRRVLLRAILIAICLGAVGLAWIFGGRRLTLFVDRFGTAEIERIPVTQLGYNGAEMGGLILLATGMLDTTGPDDHPFPLRIAPDANNKLVLTTSGISFPLGELVPASSQEPASTFTVRPNKEDEVSLTVRRSFVSWPTPFEFNFMTGHSPSWKRHRYYELIWKKRSGAQLQMVWRFEQYFYSTDGWTGGDMTREGSTGLIKAEIKP
jgi:hypothetical protein